jgi:hypothetical protein
MPLAYRVWAPDGVGLVGGYSGCYLFSAQGIALAGMQMIVPQLDGRLAVLTFTCRAAQTELYTPVVEALYTSLSARA